MGNLIRAGRHFPVVGYSCILLDDGKVVAELCLSRFHALVDICCLWDGHLHHNVGYSQFSVVKGSPYESCEEFEG